MSDVIGVNRLRPRIFVLDDLSRFVALVDSSFQVARARITEAEARLYGNQPNTLGCTELEERIERFCDLANNLSERFDLATPVLWTDATESPGFEQAARLLPFDRFDREWPCAVAFLVADDWRPVLCNDQAANEKAWKEFGNVLVHLLTRRYPDVPCFLMTSTWSLGKLQAGLVRGGAWCIGRTRSSEETHGYALTATVLTEHLDADAELRHGAFRGNPFPGQFEPDVSKQAGQELLQRLGLTSPLVSSAEGCNLQRSIATLFPQASRVEPVLVLGHGRSAASATFFVRTENVSGAGATRFLKTGAWSMIQREALAFRRVIYPHLNSHAAGLLGRPVATASADGCAPSGTIAYSLAGFPEGYRNLLSLHDLLKTLKRKPATATVVADALRRTLESVVRPLHQTSCSVQSSRLRKGRRPLGQWLGNALPPVLTGELVEFASETTALETPCLVSQLDLGYKRDVAWVLANADLAGVLSPDSALAGSDQIRQEAEPTLVRFKGFPLSEVSWENGADDWVEIVLVHPDLGLRLGLRARASTLDDGLRALWARPDLRMDVVAKLDFVNRKHDVLERGIARSWAACGLGGDDSRRAFAKQRFAGESFVDPLSVLHGEHALPWSDTIEAHEGSIHGDLNLQNILFPDGASGTGWLIDFERAEAQGMPAFDLAKLEIEILQHHVMPEVERISDAFMLEPLERVLLWRAVLRSRDQQELMESVFASALRAGNLPMEYEPEAFSTVFGLIRIVDEVREYAGRLGLTGAEMDWALGAYALVASKFPSEPWRVVWLWLTSGWHLKNVLPGLGSEQHPAWDDIASEVAFGRIAPSVANGRLDEMLLLARRSPPDMLALARALALVPRERRPVWPASPCERWDVASTGSVANITPILGYLWLMTRLAKESGPGPVRSIVVPKVSSKGKSCGTVDILASGGLHFPSDPALIVERSLSTGGVLCQQSDDLTPVDAAVMRRRRATNRMKDALLTVTSVLAKKLTMGCTHVVVDVKLGRDTKFLAPWLPAKQWRRFLTPEASGLIAGDQADALGALFGALGVPGNSIEILKTTSGGHRYLRQHFEEDFGSLQQAVWLPTNADVPQCRAVGRHLLLLHIDGLVSGEYDWAEGCDSETLLEQPMYAQLYREALPELCGVAKPNWADLREPWGALKEQLPRMPGIAARACPERWLTDPELERVYPLQDLTNDLAVVSLGATPYCSSDSDGATVRFIDAYALDELFERLCGENPYDEEVGIWLHRLPGEVFEGHDVPFISVFFRPSRTPAQTVLQWLREFLYSNVQLETP